jgi:hypothetical protein
MDEEYSSMRTDHTSVAFPSALISTNLNEIGRFSCFRFTSHLYYLDPNSTSLFTTNVNTSGVS